MKTKIISLFILSSFFFVGVLPVSAASSTAPVSKTKSAIHKTTTITKKKKHKVVKAKKTAIKHKSVKKSSTKTTKILSAPLIDPSNPPSSPKPQQ